MLITENTCEVNDNGDVAEYRHLQHISLFQYDVGLGNVLQPAESVAEQTPLCGCRYCSCH
jgi:hypothetical protein